MVEDTNPTVEEANQGHKQESFSKTLLMIPTLNEAEGVQALILEAKSSGFENVLVVDGLSTDGTPEVAEKAGATVRMQEFGAGKGCGVRTGMKIFLQGDANFLCIIDGDGTNIPSDLWKMLRRVEMGPVDLVLGSRVRGKRAPKAMSTLTFASNLTVSFLLGAKFRRFFTDVQTGYWVFAREAVQRIYPLLHSTGFEIEMELFVTALRVKLRVCEVPVGFRTRKGTTKFSFQLRLRNLYFALRYLVS